MSEQSTPVDLNRNVIDSSHVDHVRDVRLDDEHFPDAMGWRAKMGVLTPAPNTIVENEFHEMAPRGVINIINRYFVPNQKVRSDEDWMVIMKNTWANVADAVESLVHAQMDHLIMGMSSESFMGGVEGSMALRKELKAAAGGVDVTVGAEAAELAFEAVGAKRIALLTLYYPVVDKNAVQYFTDRGFDVVAVEGLQCKSIIHVGAQRPDTLIPATRRLAKLNPMQSFNLVPIFVTPRLPMKQRDGWVYRYSLLVSQSIGPHFVRWELMIRWMVSVHCLLTTKLYDNN